MQNYTGKAERALRAARRAALQLGHPYVGTEHILLGLVRDPDCLAGQILQGAGVSEKELIRMIHELIAPEAAAEFS